MSPSEQPITQLLQALERGEEPDGERLAEAVLDRLRAIAHHEIRARSARPVEALTIEPGVLASDALMKVLGKRPRFENRRHFFAYATQIMVRALIDYQREKRAQKRGGDLVRVTLSHLADDGVETVDVDALPPILDELRTMDERKAEIVQLRVFWGMTVAEVAETLQISESTVDRDWRFSKRWLSTQIRQRTRRGQTGEESTPAQ